MTLSRVRVVNGSLLKVQLYGRRSGMPVGKSIDAGAASWVVLDDDEELVARSEDVELGIEAGELSGGALLVSEKGAASAEAGPESKLEVKNSTNSAIAITRIEEALGGTREILLERLLPNQAKSLDVRQGQLLAANLYASGARISSFVTTAAGAQKFEVSLASRGSDASTTLRVVNRSTLSLALQWIDFDGTPRRTVALPPGGETEELQTFVSHPWILRDIHSGLIVDSRVARPASLTDDQATSWIFTGAGLRSLGGTKETIVEFRNKTPFPVELFWGSFEGKEERITSLLPGERRELSTRAGFVWHARKEGETRDQHLFLAAARPFQGCDIAPLSADQKPPPWITLRNLCGTDVTLWAKDLNGVERDFAQLPPRAVGRVPSTTARAWSIRATESGQEIEQLIATEEEFEHRILAVGAPSLVDRIPVEAEFQNVTPFYVDVYWVDYEGKEQFFYRLAPRSENAETLPSRQSRRSQPTYASHVWRFRERETGEVLKTWVAPEPRGANGDTSASIPVRIDLRPVQSREPAVLRFHNNTGLTVDLVWFDAEGNAKPLRTLIPGQKGAFNTYLTHPWVVLDHASRSVVQVITVEGGDQSVQLQGQDLRSKRSDRSTRLRFKNYMPVEVDLFWLDYNGSEVLHGRLRPGARLDKDSYTTHPYRFREHVSGVELGIFLPTEEATQDVDIRLRAYENRTPSSVEVRNMTSLTALVYSLDGEGKEQLQGSLKPRQALKLDKLFATHPVVVRDAHSNEAMAFTIASDGPQILNVSGRLLRSQRTEYTVWVNWLNQLSLPIDLYWVDYDGEEKYEQTIEANQAFQVSSYPSHVWRARFKGAGTEAALFVTGKQDLQVCVVGLPPVLTEEEFTRERPNKELWPGEVALYDQKDYQGRFWVAYGDLPDFSPLDGLNDRVASLRVAQGTAVTVFEDTYFNALPDPSAIAALVETEVAKKALKMLDAYKNPIADTLASTREKAPTDIGIAESILMFAIDGSAKQLGRIAHDLFVRPIETAPTQPAPSDWRERTVENILNAIQESVAVASQEVKTVTLPGLSQALQGLLGPEVDLKDRAQAYASLERLLIAAADVLKEAIERAWNAAMLDPTLADGPRKLRASVERVLRPYLFGQARPDGTFFDGILSRLNETARLAALSARSIIEEPTSDVFQVDMLDLGPTDVGSTMSSLRVLRTFAPEQLRISSTNKLADDSRVVDGKLVQQPVYRTTIQFPPEVQEVQLWGTEEVTVTVGGVDHLVGPKDDQCAVLKVKVGGGLVLQVSPDRVGVPALMLRTNSMPMGARVFLFPDADVHRKLAALEPDAFLKGRPDESKSGGEVRRLELKPGTTDQDALAAQKTIQTLSKTAAPASRDNGTGTASDSRLIVDRMEMSAFRVDFSGTESTADSAFRPVQAKQGLANVQEVQDIESLAKALSALPAAGFIEWIEGAVDTVVDTAEAVGEAIVQTAEDVAREAERLAEETRVFFDTAAKDVEKAFEDLGSEIEAGFADVESAFAEAGEWLEDAAKDTVAVFEDAIEEAEDLIGEIDKAVDEFAEEAGRGLVLLVKAAGVVYKVVVDTVEKVGQFVQYVAEKVVEGIKKVIDFLASLFDWGDILETQKKLMVLVDRGIDKAQAACGVLHVQAKKFLTDSRGKVREMFGSLRTSMGLKPAASSKGSSSGSIASDAMDALTWLLDKIPFPNPQAVLSLVDIPFQTKGITHELQEEFSQRMSGLARSGATLALAGMEQAASAFEDIQVRLVEAIAKPKQLPEIILSAILDVLERAVDFGFKAADAIVDALFLLMQTAMKCVRALLDAEIDLPVIKDIYSFISNGQPLTCKSIACMLAAIPMTIGGKIAFGVDEFKRKRLALTSSEEDVYGWMSFLAFVGTILGTIEDGIRVASKKGGKWLAKIETWFEKLSVASNLALSIASFALSVKLFDRESDDAAAMSASGGFFVIGLFSPIFGVVRSWAIKRPMTEQEEKYMGYVCTGVITACAIGQLLNDTIDAAKALEPGDEKTELDLSLAVIAPLAPLVEGGFYAKKEKVQIGVLAWRTLVGLAEGSMLLGRAIVSR